MSDTRTLTAADQRRLLEAFLRAEIARASDEQMDEEQELEKQPRYLAQELVKAKLKSSQIRNVENLAYTTNKFSDISDLLKKLIGRAKNNVGWAQGNIGSKIITALEKLRPKANEIAQKAHERYPDAIDIDLPRQIHLKLCCEFVKHLAAEFMYRNPNREESDE
jgi:hypothetical protein